MEAINIRLYYGGHFVTKKKKTTYENGNSDYYGVSLHPNVVEVCYFEFTHWIKKELGYDEVGEIWFRRKGCTLFNGRKLIESDVENPEFLQALEKDGWYHLYHIQKEKDEAVKREYYGPVVGFYTDTEIDNRGSSDMADSGVLGGESASTSMEAPHQNPRSEDNMHISLSSDSNPSNTTSLNQVNTSTLPENTSPLQNTSPLPQQIPFLKNTCNIVDGKRVKLAIVSAKKKPLKLEFVTEGKKKVQEVELARGEDELDVDGRSESGDKTDLSDEDYDDRDDDELFQQYVDHEISKIVTRSLGGVRNEVNEEEEQQEEDIDLQLPKDVEINDSDDENLSIVGSDDDENPNFPVFNPDTDFRRRIELCKGLKFPSNNIFRKALRHHAIENVYDYYYLHNNRSRVTVFCAKRCSCPWKRARILECKCKDKRKCKFKVYCCKLKDEDTWQIKKLRLKHICSHQIHNTKISSDYLAERYLEDWRDDPSMKLKAFI